MIYEVRVQFWTTNFEILKKIYLKMVMCLIVLK